MCSHSTTMSWSVRRYGANRSLAPLPPPLPYLFCLSVCLSLSLSLCVCVCVCVCVCARQRDLPLRCNLAHFDKSSSISEIRRRAILGPAQDFARIFARMLLTAGCARQRQCQCQRQRQRQCHRDRDQVTHPPERERERERDSPAGEHRGWSAPPYP